MDAPNEVIHFYCAKCDSEAYAIGVNWDAEGGFWALCYCGNDECEASKAADWFYMSPVQVISIIIGERVDKKKRKRGMDNGYL